MAFYLHNSTTIETLTKTGYKAKKVIELKYTKGMTINLDYLGEDIGCDYVDFSVLTMPSHEQGMLLVYLFLTGAHNEIHTERMPQELIHRHYRISKDLQKKHIMDRFSVEGRRGWYMNPYFAHRGVRVYEEVYRHFHAKMLADFGEKRMNFSRRDRYDPRQEDIA